MQAVFVEPVAFLGEDQGLQRILANAARASKFDGFDDILGRLSGPGDTGWLLSRRWRRWLRRLNLRSGLWSFRRTLGHRFKRIRRFRLRWLLLLLLILSCGVPNANTEKEDDSGAKHRGWQAAKPEKHHLDGFLSTLRLVFRKQVHGREQLHGRYGASSKPDSSKAWRCLKLAA